MALSKDTVQPFARRFQIFGAHTQALDFMSKCGVGERFDIVSPSSDRIDVVFEQHEQSSLIGNVFDRFRESVQMLYKPRRTRTQFETRLNFFGTLIFFLLCIQSPNQQRPRDRDTQHTSEQYTAKAK